MRNQRCRRFWSLLPLLLAAAGAGFAEESEGKSPARDQSAESPKIRVETQTFDGQEVTVIRGPERPPKEPVKEDAGPRQDIRVDVNVYPEYREPEYLWPFFPGFVPGPHPRPPPPPPPRSGIPPGRTPGR